MEGWALDRLCWFHVVFLFDHADGCRMLERGWCIFWLARQVNWDEGEVMKVDSLRHQERKGSRMQIS